MATKSLRSLEDAHNLGRHKKVPRQSCPICRRMRDAQWQKERAKSRPNANELPWLSGLPIRIP